MLGWTNSGGNTGKTMTLCKAGNRIDKTVNVRSTLLLAPSPQRRQERRLKRMMIYGCFSVDANSGIPREQNRELTTT